MPRTQTVQNEESRNNQYDMARLLEFEENNELTANNEQELMQRGVPRAPTAHIEESRDNQIPNAKLDLQNCLEYVKNQCGNHTLNQMAELLKIGRTTFFRKIKTYTVNRAVR